MIDKQEMRTQFSARLHEALDDAAIRKHGRGSDILERLKRSKVMKTPQAASKWLNGGAIPEADTMAILSEWLNVRREWLEYGTPPKSLINREGNDNASTGINVVQLHRSLGRVPIISWVKAGSWCEAVMNVEADDAESWISCPVSISKSGYALRVVGDSMTNPGPGRTYPHGSVIFVDPELPTTNGDRVVARLPNTNEATFKILAFDAGKRFLKPINPQYPTIEIDDEVEICGKIVGLFMAD